MNVLATLDIAPRRITKHKSHLQSSVFCLNQIKITHWTENHIFYGQFRWIMIWSTNKNVMKDTSLNVPATLEIAPWRITKHKSHLQTSVFCLNQQKITFSMVNPGGYWFEAQIKMLSRIKAWMYLRHLTSHLGESQNSNLTFNPLFFALIK